MMWPGMFIFDISCACAYDDDAAASESIAKAATMAMPRLLSIVTVGTSTPAEAKKGTDSTWFFCAGQ